MESPNSLVGLIAFPSLSALTKNFPIASTCDFFPNCVSSSKFPTVLAIYPGYYTGRATHIHTKVFPEWTVIKENNTFKAGRLSHVGQFFFDEEINTAIDTVRTTLVFLSPKDLQYLYSRFIVADVSLRHKSHKGHYRAYAEYIRLLEHI